MTRINIVPPSELTDQHLVAEYREIFMVPAALKRSLKSKNGFDKRRIPARYTLNSGHVMFFYDKMQYLKNRYASLVEEMKLRGMNPDPDRIFPDHDIPKEFFNDWAPIDGDFDIIRERISLRISERPGWYKMNGEII